MKIKPKHITYFIACVLYLYTLLFYILLQEEIAPILLKYPPFKIAQWMYKGMTESVWINIATCILLILISTIWGFCICHFKKKRWGIFRIFVLINTIILLLADYFWVYAPIPYLPITFKWLLITCCSILTVVEIKKIAKKEHLVSDKHEVYSEDIKERLKVLPGLTNDVVLSGPAFIGNKPYAKELVCRLLNTNTDDESFALGIHGNWGSGKTTLLNDIRDTLPEATLKMNFQVWDCSSPDQVISSFFIQLRELITANIDSNLKKPITDYAKYLLSINRMDPWWALLRSMAVWHSESKELTLKNQIAEVLKNAKQRVYVFIDDIDRLDKDEILEVLRLIRNTANLPNIVYVVAYDKEYIIGQLEHKHITAPDLYLEKFFQLEVSLPKVTTYELLEMTRKDLSQMLNAEIADEIIGAIREKADGEFTYAHLIKNFREVKRFARQLSVSLAYIHSMLPKEDICLSDFVWLEILHYARPLMYSPLKNDPSRLLHWQGSDKALRASINEDLTKQLDKEYDGKRTFDYYAIKALNDIFNKGCVPDRSSVVYAHNYNRYFTFAIEEGKVYHTDIARVMNGSEAEAAKVVGGWLKDRANGGKDANSVAYQLNSVEPSSLTLKHWKCYYSALFAYIDKKGFSSGISLLKSAMAREESPVKDVDKKNKWFKGRLLKQCSKADHKLMARWLKDCRGRGEILTMDDWTSLMVENFKQYVASNNVDAYEICVKDSTLRVISECAVTYYYEWITEDYEREVSVNLIIKEMIDWFSTRKSSRKNDFAEYFCTDPSNEEQSEGVTPEEKMETVMNRIECIFGDSENLSNYQKNCFM